MTMQALKLLLILTTNYMAVANMIELLLLKRQAAAVMEKSVQKNMAISMLLKQIVVKMANAPWQDMMVKIAAKTERKWIAAKMVSVPKKVIVEKIAAKHHTNHTLKLCVCKSYYVL